MALVGMSVNSDGSNADLDSPLSTALRKMCFVQQGEKVTDDDLAKLSPAQFDELLDRSELRLLQNIFSNIDFTSITVGPRREELSNLADQVSEAIRDLSEKIKAEYGVGASHLAVGSITQDFAAKADDDFSLVHSGEV